MRVHPTESRDAEAPIGDGAKRTRITHNHKKVCRTEKVRFLLVFGDPLLSQNHVLHPNEGDISLGAD
jgi:hypothetical protein